MYLSYYGLNEQPFSISPDPRFLYLSEIHREGLANLTYGVAQRKGFIIITGEVGTGKTTLIHALLANVPQKVRVAFISNPTLTREEFFYLLADAYKLGAIEHKAHFLVRFTQFLEKAYSSDENVVLIVDEAHSLTHELLEEIRLFSNLETAGHNLVNIILVGQPELDEKLSSQEMRPLTQRITLRYHLSSMTLDETAKYIETRLLRSGAKDPGIFTEAAIQSLYEYSRGIPRLTNVLADHALLTGYVKDLKQIDNRVIEECAGEFRLSGNKDEKDAESVTIPPYRRYGRLIKAVMIIVMSLGLLFLWWGVLVNDGNLTSSIDNVFDKDNPVVAHELIANDVEKK
ncbi:MAG: AAA family ATPase [Deltaproteobacteria bacterium]|nr:MAG: AAA family ATPase [Deltaproteobacteria bacterium]